MKKIMMIMIIIFLDYQFGFAQDQTTGLRGDPAAIAEAKAMVEAMGGMAIWAQLKSVHFVHRWYPWYRIDSYIEDEILDLTGPRSWVRMESEIYQRIRVYSPEYKYWNIENGKFSYASEKSFNNAMKRAPFHYCRLARGIACGDSFYEIRFGKGDIPRSRRLEFYGADGKLGGWIILNARKEPIVWATTEYRYILGPMKQFGNLRVPDWGVYENGSFFFQMVSLKGSNQAPELSLFEAPAEFRE